MVEVIGSVLAILEDDDKSREQISALVVQKLVKALSAVMGKAEARSQFGGDLVHQLSHLTGLMKKNWFGISRQDRNDMIASGLKTIRLLSAGEGYVQKIENEFYSPAFI